MLAGVVFYTAREKKGGSHAEAAPMASQPGTCREYMAAGSPTGRCSAQRWKRRAVGAVYDSNLKLQLSLDYCASTIGYILLSREGRITDCICFGSKTNSERGQVNELIIDKPGPAGTRRDEFHS